MTDQSERTKTKLKPKFPRLNLLRRKRRDLERDSEWFTTADADGMVQIRPAASR